MRLRSVRLTVIRMPLRRPFVTHLGAVSEREAIIVEVEGQDGVTGCGEGVAFSSPWYTEETVQTCYHVLRDFLIPILKVKALSHPADAARAFRAVKRNHMAKSAIETALWDLQAKREGVPLWRLLGGTGSPVPSGVVVADPDPSAAASQIEAYLEQGYRRVKVKIGPGRDVDYIAALRTRFPDLPLIADANAAYTLADADRLRVLDEFGLLMIEQPLAAGDLVDHAELQSMIATPICLDEGIATYEDARTAIRLGSCRAVSIKMARVGGLGEAKKIHDLCAASGIPVCAGGMIEFGVSRAHNLALASLPGFTVPGDISGSDRFWEEDIIEPAIRVEGGAVALPDRPGIGFEINRRRLREVALSSEVFPLT